MDHVADPKYFGFSFSLLLKPQKLHWNFNTFLDGHWPLNLTARLYPYCWQVSNVVSYTALELVGVVELVNQLCTLIIFIFNSLLSYIYCMFGPSVPPFSLFFFPSSPAHCMMYWDCSGDYFGIEIRWVCLMGWIGIAAEIMNKRLIHRNSEKVNKENRNGGIRFK